MNKIPVPFLCSFRFDQVTEAREVMSHTGKRFRSERFGSTPARVRCVARIGCKGLKGKEAIQYLFTLAADFQEIRGLSNKHTQPVSDSRMLRSKGLLLDTTNTIIYPESKCCSHRPINVEPVLTNPRPGFGE